MQLESSKVFGFCQVILLIDGSLHRVKECFCFNHILPTPIRTHDLCNSRAVSYQLDHQDCPNNLGNRGSLVGNYNVFMFLKNIPCPWRLHNYNSKTNENEQSWSLALFNYQIIWFECDVDEVHYTIVARVDGIHGVLYTRGGKWHPRRSQGCHLPPRVYKTHGPQSSQRATIVLLYLGNIVIPLLKVLLSSSNITKTEQCIV